MKKAFPRLRQGSAAKERKAISMSAALAIRDEALPASAHRVLDVMDALKAVRTFVSDELKEGLDYGKVPGTDRDTLFQPGAQKIIMYYDAYARFHVESNDIGDGHVERVVMATVIHRGSGAEIGAGVGSCTTMESRYRFRTAKRACPACGGAGTIVQTKKGRNPGGYWCVPDKGGCNANFDPGDPAVEQQQLGMVENPNIWDTRNTVLKIAKKRAQVDAALSLGCVSEIFTQDLEDIYDLTSEGVPILPKSTNPTGKAEPSDAHVAAETKKAAAAETPTGAWRMAIDYGVDRSIERYHLEDAEPREERFDWLCERLVARLVSKKIVPGGLSEDEVSSHLQRVYERDRKRFEATIFDLAKQRPEARAAG